MSNKLRTAAADMSYGGIHTEHNPAFFAGISSRPARKAASSRYAVKVRPGILNQIVWGVFLALLASLSLTFCVGCANPGPPKPPSLRLPAPVTDLTAQRIGDRVLLRWTTPARTTDDLPVKGAMTAQICRETGPRPGTPAARAAACAPVLRLAVVPGPSEVSDTLPAALRSDPVLPLTYRIRILNSGERSAGDSTNAAISAAGTAPPPVDSLNVTASEQGAVLEWTLASKLAGGEIEFTRTDNSAAPANAKPTQPTKDKSAKPHRDRPSKQTRSPEAQPEPFRLRATETPDRTSAGSTDTTAKTGSTYTYVAKRIRQVRLGSALLEIDSEPSAPVTIAMRDTFPPRPPSGLATIPGSGAATPYIDLSWEPNTEPDLAGYFVYRQPAHPNVDPQAPSARLTPTLVTAPAYRDVAVSPGRRYIYRVTAVDASGNESAPSAKAQEVVTPERN